MAKACERLTMEHRAKLSEARKKWCRENNLLFKMTREELVARINKLPMWARSYIHQIESKCDPSGDVQTIADLREQVAALSIQIEEARRVLGGN